MTSMCMRFLLISDTHWELGVIDELAAQAPAAAVIHAVDFDSTWRIPTFHTPRRLESGHSPETTRSRGQESTVCPADSSPTSTGVNRSMCPCIPYGKSRRQGRRRATLSPGAAARHSVNTYRRLCRGVETGIALRDALTAGGKGTENQRALPRVVSAKRRRIARNSKTPRGEPTGFRANK